MKNRKRSPTVACFAFVLAGSICFAGCASSFEGKKSGSGTAGSEGISLSSVAFRKTSADYPALVPKAVTVANTGNARVVSLALGGASADSFILNKTSVNAPANGTAVFTVVPKTELAQGTYAATVTATASGVEPASASLSFEVDAATALNPDPDFHIYLAFGQSNMQGPGAVEAIDRQTNLRFFTLNVVADKYNNENRAKSKWYYATSPLILPDSQENASSQKDEYGVKVKIGLSPADNFGRVLAANTPDTYRIAVIAVAHGDTALTAFAKDINTVNSYYNGGASGTAKGGIDRYKNAGYTQYGGSEYTALVENAKIAQCYGVVKGIIVHQGESGVAGTGTATTTWADLLKLIYTDMLSDLGLAADSIPILAGRTHGNGSGNTGGALGGEKISTITNSAVIPTDGVTGRGDNTHFNNVGIRELGKRYAEWMINYYHYSSTLQNQQP